jgi:branched-chain amino acid transport system substrate-binding protein
MRQRSALALLAAAVLVAGCSSGDYDDQAPDDATLTVYVSSPLRGESGDEGRAIVNGAKLALEDAGGEAGGVDVEPVYMDDTGGEGEDARWEPVVVADNARRAAQDSTAIAYIGDLESGATRISLPITNQASMLQVSAGSTAVDLTRTSPTSDEVPALAQPTGERTFGRVIPDDRVQAAAGAAWADELGFESALVLRGGGEFAEAVGDEFTEEAEALGIAIGGPKGDLRYLATESAPEFRAGIAAGSTMATDALFDSGKVGLITSSAQAPEQLPAPQGEDFVRSYRAAFDEPPDRYAAYGYEAMAVVLDSIERAEDPRDRSAVTDAFFATADRDSVLGTYSIDEAGDTTLDAIAGYRVEGGEPRFDSALRAP